MGCGMDSNINDYISSNNTIQCEKDIRNWEINTLLAFQKGLYQTISKLNAKFLRNSENIEEEINSFFNGEFIDKHYEQMFKNDIFRIERDNKNSYDPNPIRILIFLLSKSSVKCGDKNQIQDKNDFLFNLVTDATEPISLQFDFDKPNIIKVLKLAIEIATVVLVGINK